MTKDDHTWHKKRSPPPRPSVMFSAHYEDGRTGYFVIPGHGTGDEDYKALGAAQKRQRLGELPEGVIRMVKRVR